MTDKKLLRTIRELNALLSGTNKSLLVRKGRIIGILGNEDLFYRKRKMKRKKKK